MCMNIVEEKAAKGRVFNLFDEMSVPSYHASLAFRVFAPSPILTES